MSKWYPQVLVSLTYLSKLRCCYMQTLHFICLQCFRCDQIYNSSPRCVWLLDHHRALTGGSAVVASLISEMRMCRKILRGVPWYLTCLLQIEFSVFWYIHVEWLKKIMLLHQNTKRELSIQEMFSRINIMQI